MARNRNNKAKKIDYNLAHTAMALGGGGAAAMAWEGLDMVPKIKEKPIIAPLITAFIGVALSGVEVIKPSAFGMIGASSAELTGQVIQKIRDNKGTDDDEGGKSIGNPIMIGDSSGSMNGRLNKALQNPKMRAKFQEHMANNPQFRDAITRQMSTDETAQAEQVLRNNSDCANELFSLALND